MLKGYRTDTASRSNRSPRLVPLIGASSIALALCAASTAAAQTENVVDTDNNLGVQEIVVTAQRRSERLQDVPISVAAVTSSQIAIAGVTGTQSLTLTIPALTFNRTGNEGNVYLRGVGTNLVGPNVEQAVAIYVDGVYYASPQASVFSFNNIERIEVLKGPQGTLFGRNTTGGVIQIITKDPSMVPAVNAEVTYGNYDTLEANFYGTTGLGDKVAIDLAASYANQGKGFGKNLFNGEEVGKQAKDNIALRSKLLIEPTDTTKIVISGDYAYAYDNNTYRLAKGVVGPDGSVFPGRYNANSNFPEFATSKSGGISGRIDQEIGAITLTSITAYRKLKSTWSLNQDGVPATLTEDVFPQKVRTFSQELQLSGDTDKLNWVVGGYYYDAKAGFDDATVDLAGTLIVLKDSQSTRSYAGFGQATYEVLPGTRVTAGLRYTSERQKFVTDMFSVGGAEIPVPDAHQRFNRLTWRVSLDQKLNDDVMAYASYNRGFKSGGYNVAAPADAPYKPETNDAYEVGLKSTLFDRQLRLNLAAFWYDYRDIQAQIPVPGGTTVLNGPKARIRGIEGEFEAQLTNALRITGGLAYLDGKYLSYPDAPYVDSSGVLAPPPTTATGNGTISTPKFTGNLAVQYEIESEIGTFTPNVSVSYNDGFYYYPDNRIRQPSYAVLNVGLSWTSADERYRASVWGRNLTDSLYYIGRSEQVGNADIDRAAPPRTYGVTLGVSF